ncbi:SWIM zinc finger family protein [Streptomyces sp. NPDC029041]|uniref:SWIM zinc finger family protein n=1 Tax=Streptomyces sp. NPDC029041 TaxID=3155727 RepID=UPI0033F4E65B
MNARPSDEARRALREARERAAQDPAPAPAARPEPPFPAGGAADRGAPRPADVARDALRRAVSEQRGSGRADADAAEPAASEDAEASGNADGFGVAAGGRADGGVPGGGAASGGVLGGEADDSASAGAGGSGAAAGERTGGAAPEGTLVTDPATGGQEGSAAPDADRDGRPEAAGAPSAGRAPESLPAAVTPEPQASGDPRTSSPEATPLRAAPAPSSGPAAAGHRGADVAREALRAVRDDARRAREETEREGARRRRRARQKAVDDRAAAARRAGADAPGRGARDVGQLLSGAFLMPDLRDTPSDDDHEPTAGRADRTGRTADLLHGDDRAAGRPQSGHAPTAPTRETPDSAPSPRPRTEPSPPESGDSASRDASGQPPMDDRVSRDSDSAPHSGDPSPASSAPLAPEPPPAPPTPAAARTPRPSRTPGSMAAPARDHELRRTFPPLPPRDGDRFAESWWGNAWVEALEQGALDVKRLERGRGYAGQGHVDAITVTPGLVLAYVQGSRPRPYRVQVHLRTLDDTDWDRFLDAAADRPGHIAALLDKEMPQSLAECGVPLLPGPGDLEPRCSCPDRGHPCKHAAALCYQTARLLDADPFVLLLLRGRGERELLDALSRLSATRAARAAQDRGPTPLPGVRAAEVLAPRALPPLPAPLPPLAHPEQPPAYPAAPGGPDPFALDQLATDAAARAHALLGTGRDPVGQLTFWQDAVRLAAARPGAGLTAATRSLYSSLASAAGRTPPELARAVAAWRQGGLEGLAVLEEPWDPPAGRFDRARPLLLAADLPAFRPWRNRLTHPQGHTQLRLGRDGLWYAYESEPGRDDWWPRGTPDLDPVGALTGLGLPGDM